MCWVSEEKPERLVAKEDITVYKIVQIFPDSKIYSYYNEFPYELGKIYNTDITIKYVQNSCEYYFIENGFHSYNYNPDIGFDINLKNNIVCDKGGAVYRGPGVMGMLCIIPKGTEYYLNTCGDIVSTSIKPIALSTEELQDINTKHKKEHFKYEMSEIEKLHQLNKEISQLECKYDIALDWLFKTRKELIAILTLVHKGDIETAKYNFIPSTHENWENYKAEMNSFDYIVKTLNKKV